MYYVASSYLYQLFSLFIACCFDKEMTTTPKGFWAHAAKIYSFLPCELSNLLIYSRSYELIKYWYSPCGVYPKENSRGKSIWAC